jgi:hypothetical protein
LRRVNTMFGFESRPAHHNKRVRSPRTGCILELTAVRLKVEQNQLVADIE